MEPHSPQFQKAQKPKRLLPKPLPKGVKSSYKFLTEVLNFQIKQAQLAKLQENSGDKKGRIAHFLPNY